MGKKIYELAKELNVSAKEILQFFDGAYTTHLSGLKPEDEEKARAKFSKKQAASANKTEAKVTGKTAEDKPVTKKEADMKPEDKPVTKKEADTKPEEKPASKNDEEKKADAPVKKKKPVFVFRPENAKTKFGDTVAGKAAKEGIKVNPRDDAKTGKGPIKAHVPTTAEQYKEHLNDAKPEETKKEDAKKNVSENIAEPAAETKPAAELKPETATKKTAETKEEKTTETKPDTKETVKQPEDNKDRPFEKKDGKKVHFVDNRGKDFGNRQGQGYTSGNRAPYQGQGNRPNGQNTKPHDNNFRPRGNGGNGTGTPGFNKDRKDNRGIFGNNNRNNSNVHVNTSTETYKGKTDTHSKRNNGKDKNKYDYTGKNAENFRNLEKDQKQKSAVKPAEEVIKMITIPETITIKELAEKMKMKPADLIKKLFLQGKMMTPNSEIGYEEAENIALEYDILCEKEVEVDVIGELLKEEPEEEKNMVKRPPVVCVMGHVDHGKTSLLDAIRKTNVTSHEAGGITQHIGAYMVTCNGERITFLDTPGHEAFTAMRMRGAQATDVAILVVAADDGVKPQTIEAIHHAKAAGVEIIVAVNKIDKPAANIDRVKQELAEQEVISVDWGGQTEFVPVSAKTGEGIDDLLETVLLVTEVKELQANPNREMRGIVIEAKLDKGRGSVATVLVQKGTLKAGDFVSCGSYYGRIRAMLNSDGENLKSAGPSTPVEILGLNGVPNAGEVCVGHKNEKEARSYAETFIAEERKKKVAESKKKLTLDSLFADIQAGNLKELPIVLKADVQGSVEAVRTSLEKLSNEEVRVKVIHGGVGAINESDVSLASASNALVIGFNVKPDPMAKTLADQEGVDVKVYRVIYQAIDDVEAAIKGMQAPVYEEKVLGHAEVRQIFKAAAVGIIAGSYVLDGTFERNTFARLYRGDEKLYDGDLASLKRFKDDVKEVREGYECGIVLDKFNDIQEGDRIECYKMVQVEVK